MAMTIATLQLKDLGATVTIQSDGTAVLSKGWFENMTISQMDVIQLQAFINKYVVKGKVVA
jgi:hypothetical protein